MMIECENWQVEGHIACLFYVSQLPVGDNKNNNKNNWSDWLTLSASGTPELCEHSSSL